MRFLVFTTDMIPLAGVPTSGTALRTWGIINGLRSCGHQVSVSVPRSAADGFKRNTDLGSLSANVREEFKTLEELSFDVSNQASIISNVAPDAIICGHWPAMTLSRKPSQPLVIDLAGPHMLERHYQKMPNQSGAVLGKLAAMANADYYICSGPKQRLYFLSYLMRAEVERPEERIAQITMPLNPEQPQRNAIDTELYPRFVFGGVFLPWQDPSQGLGRLGQALKDRAKGTLTLIGGKHPNYKIDEGVYAKLFNKLAENPRVKTLPMLPYEKFIQQLEQADVALDLMSWNLERELAVTIRTTTYLWAGVPVIYNDYADLAQTIREYDAGWCISPDSEEQFADTIAEIYNNPELVQQKSANALRLAKEVFSWDRAVIPLLDALDTPPAQRLKETDIIIDFPDNASLPLSSKKEVEQYFLCRINGLSRIECRIATHNRQIAEAVKLSLEELEGESSSRENTAAKRRLLASMEISGGELKNNEWSSLELDPIKDSAGKTYVLTLKSIEKNEELAVSPWAMKGRPYPMLGLYHGGEHLEHTSLCFRTSCTRVG